MDRGAWWARGGVHGVAESDMTEQLTLATCMPCWPKLVSISIVAIPLLNWTQRVENNRVCTPALIDPGDEQKHARRRVVKSKLCKNFL